ncbi:MAG: EAL domain-containing protein, partial [Clostridia bacterium]
MMHKRIKIYLIVAVWAVAIMILVFCFAQMQDYATIINDAGIVRGGTQRVAKLELARTPNDAMIQRVDALLAQLQRNETTRTIKGPSSFVFVENLAAVQQKWTELKAEIPPIRAGGGGERLLALSEEHFMLADATVYSAQLRAEYEFKFSITVILLLLIIASVSMVLLEYRNNNKLKSVFYTDPLTQHDNNLAFLEKASKIVKAARPSEYLLLYSNINNFKFINQSYGHDAGDRLIRSLSDALRSVCKPDELCAHTTADHFLFLLHQEEGSVQRILNAFAKVLEEDAQINSSEIVLCSCGVYEIKEISEPIPVIISKATLALSQGKRQHNIAFYDDDLLKKLTQEALLTQHMHEGLERREFQVYLQPKAELATGKLIGVEVLCRWNSLELGFLPPNDFIPFFEKNGFIVTLDFYMLEQACQQFMAVRKTHPESALPFSINFSRVSLLQDHFIEQFTSIVEKHGVPHQALGIEVTESAFTMEEDVVIRMLEELKSLGFPIVMDDFGLGYSSL